MVFELSKVLVMAFLHLLIGVSSLSDMLMNDTFGGLSFIASG